MAQKDQTIEYLMQLLRFEVFGKPLPADFAPDSEQWTQLHALAKRHALAHLVESAAKKTGLPVPFGTDEMNRAVMQFVRRTRTVHQLRATLEAAGIPFILLKGTVLCGYYPEAWMRSSTDLDVLVRSEDAEAAIRALCGQAGYIRGETAPHDFQLFSPEKISVELHHRPIMPETFPRAAEILDGVWQTAVPVGGSSAEMRMSEENFYLYHIAHMMKHFCNGGCGIRFFVDLQLLVQRGEHHAEACKRVLKKCNMLPFAEAAERLAGAWFADGSMDDLHEMEQFLMNGGIFGSTANSSALRQEAGGHGAYLLRRFFPRYDDVKYYFPPLLKHRWLLPYYWVVRLISLCEPKRRRRILNEYKTSLHVQKEDVGEAARLKKQLGIDAAASE